MTEKHIATFWFPGSFLAEDAPREIPVPTFEAAMANEASYGNLLWFAVEIKTQRYKTFTADDGEVRELPDGKPTKVGKWYIGEDVYSAEDVERYGHQNGRDVSTLVSNMRGNGWDQVVLTRAGNWQPIEEGDIVLRTTSLQDQIWP